MILKNIIKKIMLIFAFALIVTGIVIYRVWFGFPVTNSQIESEYFTNQKTFESVAKYLNEQEEDSIYITCTFNRGEMFVSRKMTQISDDSISDMIYDLFTKYKIGVITKEVIDHSSYICFQRWANRDMGKGVLFSADGSFPSDNHFTKLMQIGDSNWFIYEDS